ncbi:heat shock protein 67B1 [Osmerus mordax]|uniref:heat shock protein 67B1 n=1 Tax=Osmerus mordax TaxID=8014 RepID=UPI003510A1DD
MTEQTKSASGPRSQYARDATWYPLRSWWQPSQQFSQDFGSPASLESGDLSWMEWLQRRQASSNWPEFMPFYPLLLPSSPGIMKRPRPRPGMGAREAEVRTEQYVWRVSLDVGHFAPEELTLRTREGFLEVGGQHEERADEHGFISRCFTRKYKLPIGVDSSQIQSTLSGDGVLCVEASLPVAPLPGNLIIPIQVEKKTTGEEGDTRPGEAHEADVESRPPPPSAPGAPDTPDLASGKPATEGPDLGESSLEGPGGEAHPGSSVVGHEEPGMEGRGGGETGLPAEHAGKPHASGSADAEGLPESSEHLEALDDPDSPDTLTSDQAEHADPAQHDGEPGGSGESFEELPQPEQPEPGTSQPEEALSQEPEAPDMEQQEFIK